MWLLDTNIVSELAKPRPSQRVEAWIRSAAPEALFLSVVTLGKVQAGIEQLRERDAARAAAIEAWLDQSADTHNIVNLDGAALRVWARLMHRQPDSLCKDALIAATALTHNYCVVTGDVKDFMR